MKMTKKAADAFAKIAMTAAKQSAGSASWWGFCQPKEPANIKKIK